MAQPEVSTAAEGDAVTRRKATPQALGSVLDSLRQHLPGRVETGEAVRRQHGHTLTWVPNIPPDAVVFAESTEEVAEIVRLCARHGVPLIPYGAGTSLEGHLNAPLGGISLDLSRMTRILEVNDRDLDVTVEAGVTREALESHLRDTGLFFPVDPGAREATLGGMAATRASGTTTVKYGSMRENVLSLRAVMADGRIIRTARRARKSAAGYDLTRLLVGSEGTLGIITELTLRLYGRPDAILAAVCPFAALDGACNAVIQAIQLGLGVARIELLDPLSIRAVNAYSKLALEEAPTLFLEFHGTKAALDEQITVFREIAEAEGALRFDWAAKPEERSRLWRARHDAFWALGHLRPGAEAVVTDVCVPISRLADCVAETEADIASEGFIAPLVGHVGDGNFHLVLLVDRKDSAERARAAAFLDRLVGRALAMGGTATGEHGIGMGKIAHMAAEHGPALAVMRAIKQALDPAGILNPGKILPPEDAGTG